ncbi:unnamed protein product [Linum trigynum]|uniref:Reverse transcriptase Ty1/copia-type domain-containing protein n=1 Tax=Linum trigynum TaxID=586398 RepID=A0AAV2DDA6_9ROSI
MHPHHDSFVPFVPNVASSPSSSSGFIPFDTIDGQDAEVSEEVFDHEEEGALNTSNDEFEEEPQHNNTLRKSTRKTTVPVWHKDYYLGTGATAQKHLYPISSYMDFSQLSQHHKHFSLAVTNLQDPQSYHEAVKEECWRQAMREERTALELNNTWDVVDAPPGKKLVGSKWVYKTKLLADGSIERRKARVVAKGFTQVYGVDFLDTFSPVMKINTVKTLLAVASVKNWELSQMDVSNAYLNGELEEEVYMKLPPGMEIPGKACKLKKSLYGLKQAGRQWYARLTDALIRFGFNQSFSDYSLFTKKTGQGITIILVYVDDLILSGDDQDMIQEAKAFLSKEFKVRDLGKLKYFLGLEIARSSAGISVTQRKYCLDLLTDTGFLSSKPTKTPSDMKTRLSQFNDEESEDPYEYKSLVGRLSYLTTTRPDISYLVQQLCQFQAQPKRSHLKASHRILRYLKNSPGQGLFFASNTNFTLTGYSDSDWGACPDTRRSITGYCTFLGDSLITWKIKKQAIVSKSSSEAEYRALSQLSCEVQWITQLLKDLNVEYQGPATVFCDNKSTIHMAENPVFHERTKHIEIDCHVIRERVKSKLISLKYVCTDRNLADIFTKGLSAHRFKWILFKLGVYDIYSPACGGQSTGMGHSALKQSEEEEEEESSNGQEFKAKEEEEEDEELRSG